MMQSQKRNVLSQVLQHQNFVIGQPFLGLAEERTIASTVSSPWVRVTIGPDDVLCGKVGPRYSNTEGNRRFRHLIAKLFDRYLAAPSKTMKTALVTQVVETVISRGGRFLFTDPDDGSWVDGGRATGKRKTGYCFRDAARGRIKLRVDKPVSPVSHSPKNPGSFCLSDTSNGDSPAMPFESDPVRIGRKVSLAVSSSQEGGNNQEPFCECNLFTLEPLTVNFLDTSQLETTVTPVSSPECVPIQDDLEPNVDWLDSKQLRRDVDAIAFELDGFMEVED